MKSNRFSGLLSPLVAFAIAFSATAGLTVWAAENKAPGSKARKAAPSAKAAADDKPAAAPGERPPLKLNFDPKSINRDAADRVSYAPIVKRTAASVVYVYSTKTVRGQDLSQFFNDPMLRRFFNIPDQPGGEEPDAAPRGRDNIEVP